MTEKQAEQVIERYLVEQVKRLGGRAYKFVSPGNAGVPDRLVCLGGGAVIFVEVKSEGRKTGPLQVIQIGRLSRLGFDVRVIDGKEQVDKIINEYKASVQDE